MEINEENVEAKRHGSWSLPWFGIIAAVVSVCAGIYLLTSESASADTTVFDALMHGMGAVLHRQGVVDAAPVRTSSR